MGHFPSPSQLKQGKFLLRVGLSVLLSVATAPVGFAQAPVVATGTKANSPALLQEEAYTLGAGDRLRVDSFDTPELKLEERYVVGVDGTISLPWIGSVPVQGLTIEEASAEVSKRYSRFIKNPLITVSITANRPLKVGVVGEVNRPGSYVISLIGNEQLAVNSVNRGIAESGSQWPTVTRAIQTAGGITQSANVRQIEVRRLLPSGQSETISIDLWKFIQEGELSQDVLLRDGDTVLVPKATKFDPTEAGKVAVSNFSPDTIKVNVVGEVTTPGAVTVSPNTSLNQAILAAGGFKSGRAYRGNVELIRLNLDGTVAREKIPVDFAQGLNEKTNPILRNNDVIVVRPTGLAKTADFLNVILSPLTGGLAGILGLFRLFGN